MDIKIKELEKKLINIEMIFEPSKRNEQFYQKKLEDLLCGKHTKFIFGTCDINTDEAIYELKRWKDYKNALGQVISYNHNQHKELYVCFFGSKPGIDINNIIELYKNNNVNIIDIIDNGINIELYYLLDLSIDSKIEKILKDNILIYKKGFINIRKLQKIFKSKQLNLNLDDIKQKMKNLYNSDYYSRKKVNGRNRRNGFFNVILTQDNEHDKDDDKDDDDDDDEY